MKDQVLLHHELEVTYEDRRPTERLTTKLFTLGETANSCGNNYPGGPQSAVGARTVKLTAAIGAELLPFDEVKSRGVLCPMQPEVYDPTLHRFSIRRPVHAQLEENLEVL